MLKGRELFHLRGSFHKEFPKPVEYATFDSTNNVWALHSCGPRYQFVYEITEFDDAGLKRLQEIERK